VQPPPHGYRRAEVLNSPLRGHAAAIGAGRDLHVIPSPGLMAYVIVAPSLEARAGQRGGGCHKTERTDHANRKAHSRLTSRPLSA
jgi:hypothetical protein